MRTRSKFRRKFQVSLVSSCSFLFTISALLPERLPLRRNFLHFLGTIAVKLVNETSPLGQPAFPIERPKGALMGIGIVGGGSPSTGFIVKLSRG
jgi:hypothetical protein